MRLALRSLYRNPAGELGLDPAGFLRITWSTAARGPHDAAALFEQLLAALRQQGWSRVLINQAGMHAFSPAEQGWIATDWLPRAVHVGGYRHGAVVVAPDVFVRLATAFITTNVQGLPLAYRSFDTEAEAVQWLLQQPATPAPGRAPLAPRA